MYAWFSPCWLRWSGFHKWVHIHTGMDVASFPRFTSVSLISSSFERKRVSARAYCEHGSCGWTFARVSFCRIHARVSILPHTIMLMIRFDICICIYILHHYLLSHCVCFSFRFTRTEWFCLTCTCVYNYTECRMNETDGVNENHSIHTAQRHSPHFFVEKSRHSFRNLHVINSICGWETARARLEVGESIHIHATIFAERYRADDTYPIIL